METPSRNLKNELLAAVITLVMLGSAVGLAAVLTRDTFDAENVTATVASMGPTDSPTVTALPPSPTASPLPESSPTPTQTETPRPTRTPVPTLTPTITDTPEPTTPPSETPTATVTPAPTRTPVPRLNATETPSPTQVKPTATPTTPPPSATPTATPTATVTASPTILLVTPITPAADDCTPPSTWRPYVIRSGDNLFRISLRARLPLQEMQRVNCIPNAADIEAGTLIYVPPEFFYTAPSTAGDTTGSTSSLPRQEGCGSPGSQITAPGAGSVVTGRFSVIGTATLGERDYEFNFYKVELRAEGDASYRNLRQANNPVVDGVLATANAADFPPGNYELKLTVVDATGNFIEPCAIRLTFR